MRKKIQNKYMSPYYIKPLLFWCIVTVIGFLILEGWHPINSGWNFLIALNIATFLLLLIDKLAASMKNHRVPENFLYLATFLGGSVGMLVGMYVLRHKTRKTSFQMVVAVVILIQFLIVYWMNNG